MRRRKRWVILVLVIVIVVVVVLARREPRIPSGSFLVVEMGGSYTEARASDLMGQLVGAQEPVLAELLLELRKAAVDTRLQGVLVKLTPLDLSFAQVQEIREALRAVQAAGKRVIVWVVGEGTSGNREYYLASVADRVYYAENTLLPLSGLKATYVFLGGVWEPLGIDMQVEQVKEYKTFGDFLVRKTMSEAHREMANSLLDSLNDQFLAAIAVARGLTPPTLKTLIDAPTLTPGDMLQAGLIDGIRYVDDILKELGGPDGTPVQTVSLATYRQVSATSLGLERGPKIAVVYGVGSVSTGESRWSPTGITVGADTIIKALDEAAGEATITAIVLRIESPGGSVLASDLIWQAVNRAKQRKPVVVSMAGTAASGGYYMAAGATRIVAQPATLTGSIGIVFSLPNVQRLLDKLGIGTETLERGSYARLFESAKPWAADERAQVRRLLAHLYHTFIQKVAEGRGLPLEEVDRLGGGRVWTGAQARAHGLVDELGGLQTALRVATEAAGVPSAAAVQLVTYPRPKKLMETFLERLRSQAPPLALLPQPLRKAIDTLSPFVSQGDGPLYAMPMQLQVQ